MTSPTAQTFIRPLNDRMNRSHEQFADLTKSRLGREISQRCDHLGLVPLQTISLIATIILFAVRGVVTIVPGSILFGLHKISPKNESVAKWKEKVDLFSLNLKRDPSNESNSVLGNIYLITKLFFSVLSNAILGFIYPKANEWAHAKLGLFEKIENLSSRSPETEDGNFASDEEEDKGSSDSPVKRPTATRPIDFSLPTDSRIAAAEQDVIHANRELTVNQTSHFQSLVSRAIGLPAETPKTPPSPTGSKGDDQPSYSDSPYPVGGTPLPNESTLMAAQRKQ